MTGLRANVAAETRRTQILMGVFVVSAIFLALLLGFVISWSFILPVRKAHGFLTEVAKGNFQATINVPNRDEFGDLAERMNQMTLELHNLYEDQRAAAQELQILNNRLTEASKAKSEFLANMSHELRTPMNAILGFVEMLLDDIYGEVPPHLREPLIDVQVNGKHLLNLINDVLDLSKIEAGRMELVLGEYSVQDVVETVRTSLQSLALEKGLGFEAVAEDDIPPRLRGRRRITQCLMNLVGNALKFCKRGRGGRGGATGRRSAVSRRGYRNRYTQRGAEEHFYRVQASGYGDDAGVQRDRSRAQYHQEVRGNARRPDLGGERAGKGIDLFFQSLCVSTMEGPHERQDRPLRRGQRVQSKDCPPIAGPHFIG